MRNLLRRPGVWVKLGIRGEGTLEIESGVPEGAELMVPEGRSLAAGSQVRTERD